MKCNAAGRALIKQFESLRLTAYLCPAGIPTIGYGHTSDVTHADVKNKRTITEHQADAIFDLDLEKFEEGVSVLTSALALSENQFSSLVSFAFNLGVTRLASSTLYKKLMKGDLEGAAEQFGKWTLANGVRMNGLIHRRAAERELFERAA
jgi:lysozyme